MTQNNVATNQFANITAKSNSPKILKINAIHGAMRLDNSTQHVYIQKRKILPFLYIQLIHLLFQGDIDYFNDKKRELQSL